MLCEMLVGMLDRLTSNVGSLSNINRNVMRNVGWNVGSLDKGLTVDASWRPLGFYGLNS